ncbi:hypothetical protein RJ639_030756 [Escallonia herrerae]|uniref:Quinolinate phosphoribosyl transferase C-terminal domain-containing protein n=1 Tax=Escallonia herrerae TaxID=1293975 RepID=A0AA89BDZ7_9ASTE|nr:hypothetical protein RJ639_030756 [Escallonia herrerae]
MQHILHTFWRLGKLLQVQIGGGRYHMMGLFDMVMIKDNHISVVGGVTNALKSVDTYLEQNKLQMGVEIETRTLKEVNEVLDYASRTKTSLCRIMLDNMFVHSRMGELTYPCFWKL